MQKIEPALRNHPITIGLAVIVLFVASALGASFFVAMLCALGGAAAGALIDNQKV